MHAAGAILASEDVDDWDDLLAEGDRRAVEPEGDRGHHPRVANDRTPGELPEEREQVGRRAVLSPDEERASVTARSQSLAPRSIETMSASNAARRQSLSGRPSGPDAP